MVKCKNLLSYVVELPRGFSGPAFVVKQNLVKQNLNFIAITMNNDIIINISNHPIINLIINLFLPVQPIIPPEYQIKIFRMFLVLYHLNKHSWL